jgi:GntR family transcriptional regulator
MKIHINFRSGEPIYVQIMEQIRQMVARGELKQGDQLPTVRQMATDLRVNFNTVARAYRLLDEAGLISTQQGRGTYIWERPSEETLQRLRKKGLEDLTAKYLEDAAQLGYSLQETADFFQQFLHHHENRESPPKGQNKDLTIPDKGE